MRNQWMAGALVIALGFVHQAAGQHFGCHQGYSGSTAGASGRCPHAWTYEDASALWDGYCQEQPFGGHGCGLFGCGFGGGCGCGLAGSYSRWPSDCGCEADCGGGCAGGDGIGFGLAHRGNLRGGALAGFSHAGCGCGTNDNFGWASCGCDDGGTCHGHRHGLCLGRGLGLRRGAAHCDSGICNSCGADAGGCGCN